MSSWSCLQILSFYGFVFILCAFVPLLHWILGQCITAGAIVTLSLNSETSMIYWWWCEHSRPISSKSMSFPLIASSCIAVEVKKEPEPPTEAVKQEEREPATKSSAPAPPSKPPPEKRARLQWHSSHTLGRWSKEMLSPAALTERTAWEYFFHFPKLQDRLPLCSFDQFTGC